MGWGIEVGGCALTDGGGLGSLDDDGLWGWR